MTSQFIAGAETVCTFAQRLGLHSAMLKANSPSCGVGQIYGGQFAGRLVPGDGVTAAPLRRAGLESLQK